MTKNPKARVSRPAQHRARLKSERGFALIVAVSMLVLLTLMAVAMLSLSSLAISNSSITKADEEARSNARMALMIAIGELQEAMGPDMRISAPSSILDPIEDTAAIEGVAQTQWLGVYDSWGNWLNDSYTPPGKSQLNISQTYTKGRAAMFRRWLVSLPDNMINDIDSPLDVSTSNPENWVTLVGQGSLGEGTPTDDSRITRAYLNPVEDRGRYAWWIGPENQKAKANLANRPRNLRASEWEIAGGSTSEVGISSLDGLAPVDVNPQQARKVFSQHSLELIDGIVKRTFATNSSTSPPTARACWPVCVRATSSGTSAWSSRRTAANFPSPSSSTKRTTCRSPPSVR